MTSSTIASRATTLPHGGLVWLESGAGEAIAFLHGIGSGARSFTGQLDGLRGNFRALAWSAPGYGESAAFAEDAPDVGAYAGAALRWLDAAGVARCHLVGHSLGSLIAARCLRLAPGRFATVTLASCAIGHARLPEAERARLLAGRLDDVAALGPRGMAEKRGPRLLGPDARPEHVRAVVEAMARVEPRGYAQAARMLSGGDMLADLAASPASTPLQIVYGTHDVITPPEVNLRVAAARPDARVATIERAGHALYVEAADRFNDIVSSFARNSA